MAVWQRGRGGKKGPGLIHHSGRGSQYVSIRQGDRLVEADAIASLGSVADSYDIAMAEARNGSFKAELIEHQGRWQTYPRTTPGEFLSSGPSSVTGDISMGVRAAHLAGRAPPGTGNRGSMTECFSWRVSA
ncbi:transposase InsO family protein [Streptomyces sp. HB132]|nr:transposase InsO family protein [Streptomyces sp. HB132]